MHITRPTFPPGYVDAPKRSIAWGYIEQRLAEAINYWMCTVRPDGRPHAVPRWALYVNGRVYYDGSPETRHVRNLTGNPRVALHLESGEQAVIVEGESRAMRPDKALDAQLVAAFAKYAPLGYAPKSGQWDDGGLFEFTPKVVLAWTKFNEDPTKFVLE
jgi:hypothetical protein